MKRLLVTAIAALAVSAIVAEAKISVTFTSEADTLKDTDGINLAANSLFMVYWSENASIEGFTPTPAGLTAPAAGEEFLGAFNITDGPPVAGRITGNTAVSFGEETEYAPGYLYIAVFNYSYSDYLSESSVPVGTYYGLGPISDPLSQQHPTPTTPDIYGELLSDNPITTSATVVPEPGTLIFAGIGMAAFAARWLRRRLRR